MVLWNTKSAYYQNLKGKDACCNELPEVRLIMEERFRYYFSLAISHFHWRVPREYRQLYINAPRIEKYLYEDGKALIWKKDDELVITKCVAYGLDGYLEPDKYRPFWYENGMQVNLDHTLTNEDAVLIRANELMVPGENLIYPWVKRYAEVQQCMDNNLQYANYPLMINVQDGKDLEGKMLANVLKTFKQMLINTRSKDITKTLEAINLNVPYIIDKLRYERDGYDADILQVIGINNVNTLKKERLVVAEAEANNQELEYIQSVPHELRKRACEEAKELFGVEIDVIKGGLNNEYERRPIQQESESFDNLS